MRSISIGRCDEAPGAVVSVEEGSAKHAQHHVEQQDGRARPVCRGTIAMTRALVIDRPRARCLAVLRRLVALCTITAAVLAQETAVARAQGDVDTALIVSVDVSSSVDERRYQLQMQGIASALEDKAVIDAILNGPRGGILLSLVTWDDRPRVVMPWVRISSIQEALAAAARVRALPRQGGEFTCLSKMLRFLTDKVIPQIPASALRVVVDVSGDGSDNCNAEEPAAAVRDEMAARGTTINGLPILEGREAATLEDWYTQNVKGGPGAFILPADGYEDFGRAIRQKFVIEISAWQPPMPASTAAPRLARY